MGTPRHDGPGMMALCDLDLPRDRRPYLRLLSMHRARPPASKHLVTIVVCLLCDAHDEVADPRSPFPPLQAPDPEP